MVVSVTGLCSMSGMGFHTGHLPAGDAMFIRFHICNRV